MYEDLNNITETEIENVRAETEQYVLAYLLDTILEGLDYFLHSISLI